MSTRPKDSDYSTVHFDSVLTKLIMKEIKKDVLPHEEIQVPEWELPPADAENEFSGESIRAKEEKWVHLRNQKALR